MKVYIDDYNVIGDDGEIPSGLGDSPNLIDAKLLENYAWKEWGWWFEKPQIVDIRVDEYLEFRDAVDTIHKILKKAYDQIEESE